MERIDSSGDRSAGQTTDPSSGQFISARKVLLLLIGLLVILALWWWAKGSAGPYIVDLENVDGIYGMPYIDQDGLSHDACPERGMFIDEEGWTIDLDCTLEKLIDLPRSMIDEPLLLTLRVRGDYVDLDEEQTFNDTYAFYDQQPAQVLQMEEESLSGLTLEFTHWNEGQDPATWEIASEHVPLAVSRLRNEMESVGEPSEIWVGSIVLGSAISGDDVTVFYRKGEKYNSPYPLVDVRIGDEEPRRIVVESDEWHEFSWEVGPHSDSVKIEFTYINDVVLQTFREDGTIKRVNRNFYINEIKLEKME